MRLCDKCGVPIVLSVQRAATGDRREFPDRPPTICWSSRFRFGRVSTDAPRHEWNRRPRSTRQARLAMVMLLESAPSSIQSAVLPSSVTCNVSRTCGFSSAPRSLHRLARCRHQDRTSWLSNGVRRQGPFARTDKSPLRSLKESSASWFCGLKFRHVPAWLSPVCGVVRKLATPAAPLQALSENRTRKPLSAATSGQEGRRTVWEQSWVRSKGLRGKPRAGAPDPA